MSRPALDKRRRLQRGPHAGEFLRRLGAAYFLLATTGFGLLLGNGWFHEGELFGPLFWALALPATTVLVCVFGIHYLTGLQEARQRLRSLPHERDYPLLWAVARMAWCPGEGAEDATPAQLSQGGILAVSQGDLVYLPDALEQPGNARRWLDYEVASLQRLPARGWVQRLLLASGPLRFRFRDGGQLDVYVNGASRALPMFSTALGLPRAVRDEHDPNGAAPPEGQTMAAYTRAHYDFEQLPMLQFLAADLQLQSLGLGLGRIEPGKGWKFWHRHKQQEEVYLCLSGSLTLLVDDETLQLEAGDCVRVPPEALRAVGNRSASAGVVLIAGAMPFEGHRNPEKPVTIADGLPDRERGAPDWTVS